jgi:membrane-associated phospholipid phosphatase
VLIAAGLSTVFFFLCPTAVLRPEASGLLFDVIRLVDTPANCFPSLHVALSFIVAWGLIEDGRPWAPLTALWAAAIAVSTMLVKQHCALDVAGGLLVAALSVRLSRRAAPAPIPAGEPA